MISRQCYDKPHRCPGWAGGGWNFADHAVCDGGYVAWADKRCAKWRFNRCTQDCGMLILPYVTRYIDPSWLSSEIRRRLRSLTEAEQ